MTMAPSVYDLRLRDAELLNYIKLIWFIRYAVGMNQVQTLNSPFPSTTPHGERVF